MSQPALSQFHRLLGNVASPRKYADLTGGRGSKKTTLKFPGGKDSRQMSSGATGDPSHCLEEGWREERVRDREGRNSCRLSIC